MHEWLTSLLDEEIAELKIFFIANDAPAPENNGQWTNTYNTGYHKEIYNTLLHLGLSVLSSNNLDELIKRKSSVNYVFTLLNRLAIDNSEILVSSVCEYLDLNYLGAKPNIRALAEDKHLTKILAQNLGIPTAKWKLYRKNENICITPGFDPPYFVKWRFGASSRDVAAESICYDKREMENRIKQLHAMGKDVIVEELLEGASITTPVLSGFQPIILPSVETFSDQPCGIVTYEQGRKLEGGIQRKILKDLKLLTMVEGYCSPLFESIKPVDYIRADFKLNQNTGLPNLLEFNICCNLSSGSAICQSANSIGINQKELLSHIIHQSLIRQRF